MYLADFDCLQSVLNAYNIEEKDLDGMEILCAFYTIGCYDGRSMVLLKKDDKLFIVDAAHCSCYGLENQWSPVETTETLLRKEIEEKIRYYYEEFKPLIDFCKDYFKWTDLAE